MIGDRKQSNYSTSSGPIVIKGKVVQGLGGCAKYQEEKCFISAYDAETGKAGLEVLHHREGRRTRRRQLGQASESVPRGRRNVDHRQLRSRSQFDLLGRGAVEALDARQPTIGQRRHALCQLHRGPQRRHRQTGLVFFSRSRRIAGSGRSVRARSGGRWRPEAGVQRRQGGHLMEERPQDRQISRAQGDRFSEHLRFVRSQHR